MNKMKRMMSLALALVMCAALCTAAFAYGAYESPIPEYYNGAYGKTYKVTSILYQDSAHAFRGSVWAQTDDSSSVPPDTIGCLPMLCDAEDGEAYYTGRWSYNPSQIYFHYADTPQESWPRSTFANGLVDVGTGRDEAAPASPARGASRSVSALMRTLTKNKTYPVNKSGETYGSLILTDVTKEIPDLISARNAKGLSGYIRHDDLRAPRTAEGGLAAYYARLEKDSTIPLYDLNGNVIGSYEIRENEELEAEATDIETAKAAVEAAGKTAGAEAAKKALEAPEAPAEAGAGVTEAPGAVMERIAQKRLVNGQYPTTAYGKTYGPIGLIPHVHPDLVAVYATNGEKGYVKLEEFDPYLMVLSNPNTTKEELLAARAKIDSWAETLIPVYDLEGNVVGEFLRYGKVTTP